MPRKTPPFPGVRPREHLESWNLRVVVRQWVREGVFSYGWTCSTSWDARDSHRALITAVTEGI